MEELKDEKMAGKGNRQDESACQGRDLHGGSSSAHINARNLHAQSQGYLWPYLTRRSLFSLVALLLLCWPIMKLVNFSTAAFGLSLVGAGIAAPTGSNDFKTQCLQFAPEKHLENVTRTRLDYLKPGTNLTYPDYPESCNAMEPSIIEQETCRIGLIIPTSNRSSIKFEAWFPKDWNGRYLATGNGGIGGCMFNLPNDLDDPYTSFLLHLLGHC